jgi:2-dehydropantoate 2-reductase
VAERRYTFVGAGGIGGLIGTWMARAGCDVTFVERWPEHATAITESGVQVTGSRGQHHVRVPAITPDALERLAPLETVVVAVKSQDTREALEKLLPFATPDTLFVSMQAGMNLHLFESIVGRERTVAANPHFGGALVDPGVLEAGFPNYVWIGELDGRVTPRLQQLQQDLLHWGPTQLSDNILGVVWSKFCFGSQTVMSSITAGSAGLALDTEVTQQVAGELVREAIAVAEGLGVELVGFDFFDPEPYRNATPEDPSGLHFWIRHAWPRHEVFRAPSFHSFVKTGSGMTWDLMYRKRETETSARIAALRHHAERANVTIPFNELLWEVIRGIERGERPLGTENLVDLASGIAAAGGQLLTAPPQGFAATGRGV